MAAGCWVVQPRLQLAMTDLEIFVVILGDAPASEKMFPVTAPPSDSVGKWRELVHSKSQSRLKGVAAIDLQLWKVHTLRFLHRPMC
jgi:hypothetical protein